MIQPFLVVTFCAFCQAIFDGRATYCFKELLIHIIHQRIMDFPHDVNSLDNK